MYTNLFVVSPHLVECLNPKALSQLSTSIAAVTRRRSKLGPCSEMYAGLFDFFSEEAQLYWWPALPSSKCDFWILLAPWLHLTAIIPLAYLCRGEQNTMHEQRHESITTMKKPQEFRNEDLSLDVNESNLRHLKPLEISRPTRIDGLFNRWRHEMLCIRINIPSLIP